MRAETKSSRKPLDAHQAHEAIVIEDQERRREERKARASNRQASMRENFGTPAAEPKNVKRYYVEHREVFHDYESARRRADEFVAASKKKKTDVRVRVRLRATGTFHVVVKTPRRAPKNQAGAGATPSSEARTA